MPALKNANLAKHDAGLMRAILAWCSGARRWQVMSSPWSGRRSCRRTTWRWLVGLPS